MYTIDFYSGCEHFVSTSFCVWIVSPKLDLDGVTPDRLIVNRMSTCLPISFIRFWCHSTLPVESASSQIISATKNILSSASFQTFRQMKPELLVQF